MNSLTFCLGIFTLYSVCIYRRYVLMESVAVFVFTLFTRLDCTNFPKSPHYEMRKIFYTITLYTVMHASIIRIINSTFCVWNFNIFMSTDTVRLAIHANFIVEFPLGICVVNNLKFKRQPLSLLPYFTEFIIGWLNEFSVFPHEWNSLYIYILDQMWLHK